MVRLILIFSLIWALSPLPAEAFNLLFLKNSPASEFNDQDWELLKQTVNTALEGVPKGEVLHWENPETGHLGSVTMLGSMRSGDRPCRVLKVYNEASKSKGESNIKFCKQEDGEWKLVTQSPTVRKN